MNKLAFTLIAFLTLNAIQPCHASYEDEMEKGFTPGTGQMVDLAKITPKDSYQWLEWKGFALNPLHRRALVKPFRLYSKAALQRRLDLLEETGVLARCQDAYDVAKMLDQIPNNSSQFLSWVQKSGVIKSCENASDVLTLNQEYDNSKMAHVMAELGILRHCGSLEHVLELFSFEQELAAKHQSFLWNWLKQTQVLKVCKNLTQVQRTLIYLQGFYEKEKFDLLMSLEHSDVFGLCQTIEEVQMFVNGMGELVKNKTGFDYTLCRLGKASNQEFENMDHVFRFMHIVKTSSLKARKALVGWMYKVERMQDEPKASLLKTLRAVKAMSPTERQDFLSFLKDAGKYGFGESKSNEFNDELTAFLNVDENLRNVILENVQAKPIEEGDNSPIALLIKTFQTFTAEERALLLSLPFSWDHDSKPALSTEAQRLDMLRFFQSFDPALRTQILGWLRRTVSKRNMPSGRYTSRKFKEVFDFLRIGPALPVAGTLSGTDKGKEEVVDKPVLANSDKGKEEAGGMAKAAAPSLGEWVQRTNWFAKSNKFEDLETIKSLLMNVTKSLEEFSRVNKSLLKNGLIDIEFLELLITRLQPKDPMYIYLAPLLNADLQLQKDEVKKEGPIQNNVKTFYLFLLGAGYENERISNYFEEELKDAQTRGNLLGLVVRTLGEDHAVTQYYLNLGRGYVDFAKDRGFVVVNVLMRKRSAEEAVHKPQSDVSGCALNLDIVTEPAPPVAMHMPVTEWYALCDKLKALPEDTYKIQRQETTLSSLASLRNLEPVVELLDPEGSTKAKAVINSYSQMLRAVLSRVQADLKEDANNLGSFVQLLLNIMSCNTSKLNGITQSHLYLNRTRLVEQCDFESMVFRQDLIGYIKDELRRFREAILTNVITKISSDSPHNIYYGRGVLGHEIGIMLKGEVPKIDLNGESVSHTLRGKAKQELLDEFYKGYKIQAVIDRVRHMLNTGVDGAKNLVIKVVCNMFGAKALSDDGIAYNTDYVEVGDDGKAKGFTHLAVKELLLTLGILKAEAAVLG